ncbi:MAG: NADH-quinone oxidoreductase subunit NuoK [Armatimonadota bacterium]
MSNGVPTNYALILAGALLAIGGAGVLMRRNLVYVLMSLEIMLAAAAVAFVAAGAKWNQPDGQAFYIFILITAAAEVAVGLSLLLRIYSNWKSVDMDQVDELKENIEISE